MSVPFTGSTYDESRTLYEISSKLNQSSTPAEWLEAVSAYARQRGAVSGYLFWVTSAGGELPIEAEIAASWILDDGPHKVAGDRVTFDGFWRQTNRSGWHTELNQATMIGDVLDHPNLHESILELYEVIRVRAVVLLPQIVKGRWVSLLGFNWREPMDFDERDQRIFTMSMQLSGSVIELMRLTEEERRRAARIEQVNAINVALMKARDEDEILGAIADYAEQTAAHMVGLWYLVCDETGNPTSMIRSAVRNNSGIPVPVNVVRPTTESFQSFLLPDGIPNEFPLLNGHLQIDPTYTEYERDAVIRYHIRAAAFLPLRNAGVWQGIIFIYWQEPRDFSDDERQIYNAIVPTASAVVASRRAYLEIKANEEAMTILYRLAESVTAASTMQEVLEAVAELLPDCDGVYLNMHANVDVPEDAYSEVIAAANVPDNLQYLIGARLPLASFPIAEQVLDDRIVCVEDIERDSRVDSISRDTWTSFDTRAFLSVKFGDVSQPIGGLFFNYVKPRPFSVRERQLALGIGDLVFTAYQRIQSQQETAEAAEALRLAYLAEQESREETALLYQASEAVNAAMTFPEVIKAIAPLANEIEKVNLILWEHLDFRKASYFEVAAGIYREGASTPAVGKRFTVDQFPVSYHMARRRQLAVEDIHNHPLVDPISAAGWKADGIGALLMVSLVQDERWYGVLSFESAMPRQYSERDRRLTLAISDLALSAVIRIQAQIELAAAAEAQRLAYMAEQESRKEMSLLYQASEAINRADTTEEVIDAIRQIYPPPMDISIFVWENHNRRDATYAEALISTDTGLPAGTHLPRSQVFEAGTLEMGATTVIDDVNSPAWLDVAAAGSARMYGLQSIAYTNLIQGDVVVGVFAIGSKVMHRFTPDEIRLMSALADLTSAALERFWAHQAQAEAQEDREALFRASQAINAAQSFREILNAAMHIDFDEGDYYLYIFENFDYRSATYIETVATGKDLFMHEGMRIALDDVPFLKTHPRPGLWAYEDVPNHPELDPVTKATMMQQGVYSNLRYGLAWRNRVLGAFGVDHATPKQYSERDKRLMAALGDLVSAAVERIRLQQETYAAKEKAERLAEQAQQLAALEERNRLARELHDSVSQALYGIALGAQTAKRFMGKQMAQVEESVDYILTLAEAGLAEMRALIFELRPESLENQGLAIVLAKQGASLQARHGIEVRLELCDDPPLRLETKESLYRAAREALHNVVKHAGATQVTLRMCQDAVSLKLEVIDNGVGFETKQDFPGHLGLHSMKERVIQLGGQFSLESTPGHGTHLTIIVPLEGS